MSHKHIQLNETVHFWFAANNTSGSGADGSSPQAHVRRAGAAPSVAPVFSPTPVLLSHANYPSGAYEIAIAATAGNGFSDGSAYGVFCTLAVDSQNPTGFVGSFIIAPIAADVRSWNAIQLATTNPLPNAAAGAPGGLPTDSAGKTAFNDIPATDVVSGGPITTIAGAVGTVNNLTNAPLDSAGVTTLLSRLTALRAGYLDNLSGGPAATAAALAVVDAAVDAIKTKTDQMAFTTPGKLNSRVDYVGGNAVTSPDDMKADVSGLSTSAVTDAIKIKTDQLAFSTPNKVNSRMDYVGGNAVAGPDDLKADVSALATQAALDIVNSVVDAIKVKTDQLAFSTPNKVDGRTDYVGANPVSSPDDFKADVSALATQAALDAVKAVTDALTVASAANLALSAGSIEVGAAVAGTLTTTEMTVDLTETKDGHYNGAILIFTSGSLAKQRTRITGYDGTSTPKKLTFVAITNPPLAGDNWIIL